ncbi:MAG TPA: DUF4381 domain-containing protein [Pseudoxanthomonas sp.]
MRAQELVLRDVHVPAAPSLWPPALGWWLLAAAVLLLLAVVYWVRRRRLRRLRAWQAMFDNASSKVLPAAQIAAISELLRRAARRVDSRADKLQGDDWLRFLDGEKRKDFSEGAGRLLLEGGYRREVGAAELAATRELAQARFLELMAKRK